MNDLETRLSEMLHERAAAARPEDRLGDVLQGESARVPRHAWWPAVAAAATVLLALGGLWIGTRGESSSRIRPGSDSTVPDLAAIPAPPLAARMLPVSLATDEGWFVWGGQVSREWRGDGAYYDAGKGTWTPIPESPVRVGINEFASGIWTGDEVLVVAGGSQIRVAAFDPSAFAWRSIAVPVAVAEKWPTVQKRYVAASPFWIAGRVVLFFPSYAGQDYPPTLFAFDPASGEWSIRAVPSASVVPDGSVDHPGALIASDTELFLLNHVDGTHDPCPGATTVSIYDAANDTWRLVPLPHQRWTPAIMSWTGSGLLLAGGTDCFSTHTDRTAVLDPVTGEWSAVATVPSPQIQFASSVRMADGEVVSVDISGAVYVYDPTTDQWWHGHNLGPDEAGAVGGMRLVLFGRELYVWSPQVGGSRPTGTLFHVAIPDVTNWVTAPTATWDERSPVAIASS